MMLKRYYRILVTALYWCGTLLLLFWLSPISVDGDGPTPTFYWGARYLAPTMSQYNSDLTIRLKFLLPYFIGATVITLVGCWLPVALGKRLGLNRASMRFMTTAAISLGMLALLATLLDIGTMQHFWKGPLVLLSGLTFPRFFLVVAILASVAAGLVTSVEHALAKDQPIRLSGV